MGICPNVFDKIDRQTNLLSSLSTLNANFSALSDVVCGFYNIYPIGSIIFNSSKTYTPAGWIVCDGRYVDGSIYTTLCSLISGIYGPVALAGPANFFKIPDCRGRNLIQAGSGAGLTTRSFGSSGGQESVALTAAQMGTHTHTVTGSHTHTGLASHTHAVHDPTHIHDIDDPGHEHFIYYGISPDTIEAQFLSAGYNVSLGTAFNAPSALTPLSGQDAWGESQAVSATSVYQDEHFLGAYTLSGVNYSTVPDKFWLQNYNTGGPQLLFGSTPLSYWIKPVTTKTTATPLQITVAPAFIEDVAPSTLGIPYTETNTFTVTITSNSTGVTMASSVGAGEAHENMSPYIGMVPIIRAL